MSERIDNPTHPPTVVIADGGNLSCTGANRTLGYRRSFADDEQSTAGCAPMDSGLNRFISDGAAANQKAASPTASCTTMFVAITGGVQTKASKAAL